MSTSFTQVFGGNVIYPSDVSYLALALSSNLTLEWPLEATTGNNVVARIIDVTPSGIYTITMPDATKVGVGQTILFNNLGPNIVTVNTAAGNAILSMGAGEQWQIYLTSNATIGGTWRTFRYGASTAQAQASTLAGPGIVALGSTLAQTSPVTNFSSTPTSLTTADRAKTFVWTGGLGTVVLPTAVSATNGWFVNLCNAGSGDLTIDPSGSETINNAATLTLQPGDSASVVTDGAEWYTIGLGQQAVFAFDYTSIPVTTGTYTLSGSELNRIAYKFTGTLTGNVTVVVPATVQQYWINNATTGAFTLSVRVAGSASPVTIPQGTTGIYYSDGTDIIQATTAAAFAGIVSIAQGGTNANNAPSALTNLGGTGIGTSVFTAATTAAARTAIAAAASGANSDITSLTGLTTPLSVAQGGTGSNLAATARSNLGAAASGSNSDITALTASGGIQIGAPTGGAQGTGTINATGLFINGVGVGTGSGSVTSVAMTVPSFLSVSGSPISTSGTLAVSLSGTALPVANGGTGQTTYTDGQLLIGNTTGNTLTKSTLTAGSGITITNGAGSITIAATGGGGTVTSVDVSGGSTGLTTSGGPITGSGTITLGGTLAVTNGGTGAATASGARLTLGAAASGANSDITSLTGLTTALSLSQGGTGATDAAGARTSLSVPSTSGSGASGTWNISISGNAATATTATSATTATTATTATNVTGTVAVANGGTGVVSLTSNYLVRGNGTSAVASSVIYDNGTNIGIGTATPGSKLDVAGTVTATGINSTGIVEATTPNSGTTGGYVLRGNVTTGNAIFQVRDSTGTTQWGYANITSSGTFAWSGDATFNGIAVGYRNVPRTTTGTNIAAIGDVGKCISISANIQIPNSVFAAGDVVSIYNNSAGPLSITQGSGLSLILAGTTNTGTRSIARNGMATIWFENSSTAIISGPGIS